MSSLVLTFTPPKLDMEAPASCLRNAAALFFLSGDTRRCSPARTTPRRTKTGPTHDPLSGRSASCHHGLHRADRHGPAAVPVQTTVSTSSGLASPPSSRSLPLSQATAALPTRTPLVGTHAAPAPSITHTPCRGPPSRLAPPLTPCTAPVAPVPAPTCRHRRLAALRAPRASQPAAPLAAAARPGRCAAGHLPSSQPNS